MFLFNCSSTSVFVHCSPFWNFSIASNVVLYERRCCHFLPPNAEIELMRAQLVSKLRQNYQELCRTRECKYVRLMYQALVFIAAALRPSANWRRSIGWPRAMWLRTIDEGVQPQNFRVHTALRKAREGDIWQQVVRTTMPCWESATKKKKAALEHRVKFGKWEYFDKFQLVPNLHL